ncbi:molybdopterin-synthase adenylyltransferase MoeB [soil metagenome]
MSQRVTLVGAGGLGGPIGVSLGAAGIEITVVDHDIVELSNLHRQVQFTADDIGAPKAEKLAALINGRGGVAKAHVAKWVAERADELGGDCDLVVDGSDDPVTKFAVADWAVANGRQYVIAAALQYGGNVLAGAPGSACYRCLFEEPVDAPTCAEAGVLGPVVGAVGGVAAALALALLGGERMYAGALLAFDDLRKVPEPRVVRFAPRPDCPACNRAMIKPHTDAARPVASVAKGT